MTYAQDHAYITELREEIERHRKTLEEIARLQILSDDNLNRITLHCAIEIAKEGLREE